MKKLFAAVVAVAMALLMTPGFALFCDGLNWSCADDSVKCGKATIEIVEMVRTNSDCGFEFKQSDCAAAVAGENVYFAVRLTIPEDVNPNWLSDTTAQLKAAKTLPAFDGWVDTAPVAKLEAGVYWLVYSNVSGTGASAAFIEPTDAFLIAPDTLGARTKYVPAGIDVDMEPAIDATPGTSWAKVTSSFTFGTGNVFAARADRGNASVCARLLTAGTDGFKGVNKWLKLGNYNAMFLDQNEDEQLEGFFVTNSSYDAYVALSAPDGRVVSIAVAPTANIKEIDTIEEMDTEVGAIVEHNILYQDAQILPATHEGVRLNWIKSINAHDSAKIYMAYTDSSGDRIVFQKKDGTVASEPMTCAEALYVKSIMELLNFDIGTCITYRVAKGAFGYGGEDDTVKDCSSYRVGGVAIVDASCEIEIPKTGDATVLTLAATALVAAVAALRLKK